MAKIPYCVRHYRAELTENHGHGGNPRQQKKFLRKAGMADPVYHAYLKGDYDSIRPYHNPYPDGRRHNEYKRGYLEADPLGNHHGRNY